MKISAIVSALERIAHPSLQESYDNSGLLTGDPNWECSGVLCTLDSTEEVIAEAAECGINLVVAHHPLIFTGLKRLNGSNAVERTLILAIRHQVAIYAIHTNLDNRADGVNKVIADRLGLIRHRVLDPRNGGLRKIQVYVPIDRAEAVRSAMFAAGAGHIGNYDECSFNTEGSGTFRAGKGAEPFVGQPGERHIESELKMEMVLPAHAAPQVIAAMKKHHPYEEVAYDLTVLANPHPSEGAGLLGELEEPVDPPEFLARLKQAFGTGIIRHTALPHRPLQQVAVCGGAGAFLIGRALAARADAFVTADLKYHDFFQARSSMLLADIGHFESEQYTADLLVEVLVKKFPNFAVLKSRVNTNPVRYYQ